MKTYIILLRGVTPTGKNRVPMSELRAALTDTGLLDVQTYIQSGNVVAKSHLDQIAIQSMVHDAIAQKIGANITIIARTHKQIKHIMERNPFHLNTAARTYFSLLTNRPMPELVEGFQRLNFSPDDIKIMSDTIYTLYATKHSDSKFNNNFFERKLKVAATTRNFNTMSRLLKLSE